MSSIILGGSSEVRDDQEHEERGDSRRVSVTTFLSLGHLVPWGGSVDIRRVPPHDLKDKFKDKRIDLFVCPDLELMGTMLRAAAMASGQMPNGAVHEQEAHFCDMLESAVRQMAGCHVRRIQKPRAMSTDRKTYYVQFFARESDLVGNVGLGSVWWEISAKDVYAKPDETQSKVSQ